MSTVYPHNVCLFQVSFLYPLFATVNKSLRFEHLNRCLQEPVRVIFNLSYMPANEVLLSSCFLLQTIKQTVSLLDGCWMNCLPPPPPPPRCSSFHRHQEKQIALSLHSLPQNNFIGGIWKKAGTRRTHVGGLKAEKTAAWGSCRSWWVMGKSCDV